MSKSRLNSYWDIAKDFIEHKKKIEKEMEMHSKKTQDKKSAEDWAYNDIGDESDEFDALKESEMLKDKLIDLVQQADAKAMALQRAYKKSSYYAGGGGSGGPYIAKVDYEPGKIVPMESDGTSGVATYNVTDKSWEHIDLTEGIQGKNSRYKGTELTDL